MFISSYFKSMVAYAPCVFSGQAREDAVLMELVLQVVVGHRMGDGPWKECQINWSWRHEAA